MSVDDRSGRKLEYVKPRFRALDLVAEEVMAVGCKLPTSGGSFGTPPMGTCTVPGICVNFTNVS